MLFVTDTVEQKDLNNINNFFSECDNETTPEETNVSKYLSSLVSGCYQKSVDGIENTKIGHKLIRKRNFQQIMQESFFYGANRFGNNFIA